MTSAATVEGSDRIRLFLALRFRDETLDALDEWRRAHLDVRSVRLPGRDHLHLTLAFLGHRPRDELASIAEALGTAVAVAAGPIELSARGYRETRSVGMLVLDDEGGRATALADDVHGRLERLGVYEREARAWLPHVTVVRFRERPRLRPPLPDLGTFSPSDAAVYLSVLRPGGAQYDVLESFALGG
jgi:2'-5' RNA ligase